VRCDLAALPVAEPGRLQGAAAQFDRQASGALGALAADERFTGTRGRTVLMHRAAGPARRVLLVGTGPAHTIEGFRRYAAVAVRRAQDVAARRVLLVIPDAAGLSKDECVRAVVEGARLGAYRFDRYRANAEAAVVEDVEVFAGEEAGAAAALALLAGDVTARAVEHARDLVNEPPNVLTPSALAADAERIGARDGLGCTVIDAAEARDLGMGLFAAVAAGSAEAGKMIVLEYRPGESSAHVPTAALVGKGITFDSGGFSIKSADKLWRQKADMGGAAAVVAVMGALRALAVRVRVVAVIAATENAISGTAVRPGDIVRGPAGKTVEILNTDGEGRLVLADALTYAGRYAPDVIIDLATLTAAAAVALGTNTAAVIGTDQRLIDDLLRAAALAGEPLWQLPLYDKFADAMRSELADLRNIAAGPGGGAEKAAGFLRQFVGDIPWAHIDIGKAAFCTEDAPSLPYRTFGGTGYGVRTLLRYLTGLMSAT